MDNKNTANLSKKKNDTAKLKKTENGIHIM